MRSSPMIEFSVQEFEARIAGLAANLREAGLDGMMITSKENTRYYSGLQSIIWSSKVSTPGIVFVSADGKVEIVGSASAVETARYTGCVDDALVSCFNRNRLPGIPSTYPEALAAAMQRMGLVKGRLGMELGKGCYFHLQLQWLDELLKLAPVEMVDASALLWKQRQIKSAEEVAYLRHICAVNEASLRYAFAGTRPGETTEADFFRLYAQEAFRRHCENVAPLSVRFGPARFDYPNCPAREDVVIGKETHGALLVCGGLFDHGYYSDTLRTGIVGEMSAVQKSLADAAADTQQYALSLVRAGASIAETTAKVDAYASKGPEGARYRSRGSLGHSVGLDQREFPLLRLDTPGVFEEGMVLNIEPQFGAKEHGLFCCEQTVVVEKDGCTLLNTLDPSPYILK